MVISHRRNTQDDHGKDIAQTLRTASANQGKWPAPDRAEFVRLAFGSKRRMYVWLFFWQTLFVAPVVVLSLPVILLLIGYLYMTKAVPLYAIAAFGILAAVATGIAGRIAIRPFVHRFHQRAFAKRTIPTLLAMGRCGACCYNIAGCPADAAQTVICPECGAAWLASNVGSQANLAVVPPPAP